MFGIGSKIQRVATFIRRVGSSLLGYKINSKTPDLVADFNGSLNDGTEFYDAGGTVDSFAELITHSRAGNATMTDGYGPELVVNGGFTSDSDWTLINGSITGGEYVGPSSGIQGVQQNSATPLGSKTYLVEFDAYVESSATTVYLRLGSNLNVTSWTVGTAPQTYSATASSGGVSDLIYLAAGSPVNLHLDNISVREIPAIKWAPHNLLRYSETPASWANQGSTDEELTDGLPTGISRGWKLIEDTSTNQHNMSIVGSDTVVGGTYRYSGWVKAAERSVVWFYSTTAARGIYFDLSSVTATNAFGGGLATTSGTISDAGNGWYFCQLIVSGVTGISGQIIVGVSTTVGTLSYIGDGASGAYFAGMHLYRSDLGGMVDNPETGDSYVRTAGIPTGSNLITNGDFSTDTDWTKGTGVTISGGVASFNSASGTLLLSQSLYAAQKSIVVQVTISNYTSGILRIQYGAENGPNLSGNGTYEFSIVGLNSSTYLNFHAIGGSQCVLDIDNVSVKETDVNPAVARYLPRRNHHVYNGDAWVNEGILHESEARTNLAPQSDISNGSVLGATRTDNNAVSPDGTQNAFTLTATGTSTAYIRTSGLLTSGASYAISIYAKAGTNDIIRIANVSSGQSGQWFDLTNGTLLTNNGANNTATIQDVGNGWYRCTRYFDSVTVSSNDEIFIGNSSADGATTAISGSTVHLYGFQVENNATSSSFIPTSGSTVSRALETLTIPAANMPWPEPNYIGPELVVNGDFSTDSNWGKGAGWTISGGQLSHAAGTAAAAIQTITLTTGKVYRATCDVIACSGGSGSLQFRSGGTTTGVTITGSSVGQSVEVIYVAEGNTQIASYAGSGTTLIVDNISVREIDPLSVSIQMNGRMTYADTDNTTEVALLRWGGVGNWIRWELQTLGTNTGRLVFQQAKDAVYETLTTDAYFPGVLVPYNIASRHGSTFINGAVDGVALTADTTPTGLVDLSATDFNLGYDYMGTISMLRVWADDLADVGIVEASEPSEVPSLQLTFDNSETSFTIQDWEQ